MKPTKKETQKRKDHLCPLPKPSSYSFLLFLAGLSSLFFFGCLLPLVLCLFDGPVVFFDNGYFLRAASDITPCGILQKSFPWLLITLSDNVGGSIEQQK
jgi:hypothetical protein